MLLVTPRRTEKLAAASRTAGITAYNSRFSTVAVDVNSAGKPVDDNEMQGAQMTSTAGKPCPKGPVDNPEIDGAVP